MLHRDVSSHRKKPIVAQVVSGLRLTGALLLGGVWLGTVFAGLAIAFTTPSTYPPIVGWGFLVLAVMVAIATARFWVKALPGIFFVGAIGCLLMLISGNVGINRPTPIPRSVAAIMTVFASACAVLSDRLTTREISVVDRMCLAGVIISFMFGLYRDSQAELSLGGMLFWLVLAYGFDYSQLRGKHKPKRVSQK